MTCIRYGPAIVDIIPDFKVGSQPPKGFMDWFAWAEVQSKGGLRQRKCRGCHRYYFPQEAKAHRKCAGQCDA